MATSVMTKTILKMSKKEGLIHIFSDLYVANNQVYIMAADELADELAEEEYPFYKNKDPKL